jgi:hypothetical protein
MIWFLWPQDKERTEKNSFIGMGGFFNDNSFVGSNHVVTLVEEAMHHWTKIWGDDAIYEKAIALNVQVSRVLTCVTYHVSGLPNWQLCFEGFFVSYVWTLSSFVGTDTTSWALIDALLSF